MSEQLKINLLNGKKSTYRGGNAKELCVLSGGDLFHHPDVFLDGSWFVVRSASCTSSMGTQIFRRI